MSVPLSQKCASICKLIQQQIHCQRLLHSLNTLISQDPPPPWLLMSVPLSQKCTSICKLNRVTETLPAPSVPIELIDAPPRPSSSLAFKKPKQKKRLRTRERQHYYNFVAKVNNLFIYLTISVLSQVFYM